MTRSFDRLALLDALEAIGAAALAHGTRLHLAIYGGSALMLAGNFRFATEDVDIAEIDARPAWLDAIVAQIAATKGWSADWLNDTADAAMQILARYFPVSAQDTAKQRFLLKHLSPSEEAKSIAAPTYPGRGVPPRAGG